ncbi:MAG TPA: AsmA-like C-terminal region-containing protein [Bacteroidales bacterium]|nr:AsmA-like C-terminal region-containing protein [Bacteroidales bacterium]
MKFPKKILKLAGILVVSAVIVLFALSVALQDKVAEVIIRALNKNLATKIEIGSYHLSLLRKFPKASFELKNIRVYSSPGFEKSGFSDMNTDTLLAAASASIDFKMIDLFRGVYSFKAVNVRSGNLNLFTDSAGRYNYSFTKRETQGDAEREVRLNLDRINVSDVRVLYSDLRADLVIRGLLKNGRIRSKIRGANIDFDGSSDVLFTHFSLKRTVFNRSFNARMDVGLNRNEKGIFFRKSTISFDKQDIIMTGLIIPDDNYLDLSISGNHIDISKAFHYLSGNYKTIVSEYRPSGIFDLDCRIKGKSTRFEDPHYDIAVSLEAGGLHRVRSGLKMNDVRFTASMTNGARNRPETSTLEISDFTAGLGSSVFSGSFSASDFSRPRASLKFRGILIPSELKEFAGMEALGPCSGSIDLDISLSGVMEKKDHYSLSDLAELNSRSEIIFRSFGTEVPGRNFNLRNTNGKLVIAGSTSAEKLEFNLNDQEFSLSGNLDNLPKWLAGKPVNLTGHAYVYSPCLKPEYFFSSPATRDETVKARAPLALPRDVMIDLTVKLDSLKYKKFDAGQLHGEISLKPGMLNFRSLRFKSQDGTVTGNGIVVQNRNKSFTGRGSFSVSNVDVKKSFISFNNFGQNFLKAENIAGSLSGTITLVLPADSMLNPAMKSLVAEGKYSLSDGALINFDPVKALSKFISLSELENIKFDKLDNDFFIRNNYFYVPVMQIRSSAVDLAVNGRHSFDNAYEYHVEMLLSEILSRKAKKNRKTSSEFDEVEDDGLGRTRVFLKLMGKGEDVDVTYDMKAAGSKIKNDLRNERQMLKTILNEEYGWYPSETEQVKKETASKPRFRISWEGTETTGTEQKTSSEKKDGGIRKFFRKK